MKMAFFAAAVAALVAPGIVAAQQGASRALDAPAELRTNAGGSLASATELVSLMNVTRVIDPMFQQMMPVMVDNMANALLAAPKALAALKAKLSDPIAETAAKAVLSEELTASLRGRYTAIADETAKEYVVTFTEAHLQSMFYFYSNGGGAKMLAAQPRLQQALSERGRAMGMSAAQEAIPKAITRITAAC